ncbi:MAG: ABC transporter permease [Acidobacteriota bacterium]
MPGLSLAIATCRREFRKQPAIGILTILTISLAIGITTTVFGVMDSELLRSLPYWQPDQIVVLKGINARGEASSQSYPYFQDLSRSISSFEALSAYREGRRTLKSDSPQLLTHLQVSPAFFQVFGVKPFLGRTWDESNLPSNEDRSAIVTHSVWRRHFKADPEAIGKQVILDGEPFQLIGVMPPGFQYPIAAQDAVYVLLRAADGINRNRGSRWLSTIAKLKPGLTLQKAQEELDRVCDGIGQIHPNDKSFHLQAHLLKKWVVRGLETPLKALWYAALSIALIGCVNVGALMTSRSISRQHDMGLMIALGARPRQIFSNLIGQSLIWSLAGLAGGLLLVEYLLVIYARIATNISSRGLNPELNSTVLAAAAVAALLIALFSSLVPIAYARNVTLRALLNQTITSTPARSLKNLRSIAISGQAAIAMVLLIVAGLLIQSVIRWRNLDLGFDPRSILTTQIELGKTKYEGSDLYRQVYEPLIERIQSLPGVDAVALAQSLPLRDCCSSTGIHIAGTPQDPPERMRMAADHYVSANYHRVLGMRLIRGRLFDPGKDGRESPTVCLINDVFANEIFGNSDPLGRVIDQASYGECSIIGVVSSVRQQLFEPPAPEQYWLLSQIEAKYANTFTGLSLTLRMQGGDPLARAKDVQSVIRQLNPDIPLAKFETMDQVVGEAMSLQRLQAWVFGVFAGLAAFLAGAGLFGIVTYEVANSGRDIGVKLALGASRLSIITGVLSRVAGLLLISIAIAAVIIMGANKILAAGLAIHPAQELGQTTQLIAALFLAGMLAALLPAVRASKINPIEVLRH